MTQERRVSVLGIALLLGGTACARHPAPAPEAAKGAPSSTAAAAEAKAPPPTPTPTLSYEARLGQEVYRHYCQTCHGETGAGDGFNAFNLDPKPRDLSDPAFQAKKTDADLEDTVRRGGSGVGLSALMPPWGRTLSDDEVHDVILFVRSLRRPPG